MRHARDCLSRVLAAATRRTPAFTSACRPATETLAGQLWAGLTRSTPAFTGARPPLTPVHPSARSRQASLAPRTRDADVFVSTFGDSDRAETFIHDTKHHIALALCLSPPLGVRLADQIARKLTGTLGRASAPELGAARALSRALALALALARQLHRNADTFRPGDSQHLVLDIERHLEQATSARGHRVLEIARARICVRVLALGLECEPDVELVRDIGLTRARDVILSPARDVTRQLARDIAVGLARELDLNDTVSPAGVRPLTRDLAGGLDQDLGGADLTGADLSAADFSAADLRGVLWSASTSWPKGMLAEIQATSTVVQPGVFRFDGGMRRSPVGVQSPAAHDQPPLPQPRRG